MNSIIRNVLAFVGLADSDQEIEERRSKVHLFLSDLCRTEADEYFTELQPAFSVGDAVIYDQVLESKPVVEKGTVSNIEYYTYTFKRFLHNSIQPILIGKLKKLDPHNLLTFDGLSSYLKDCYRDIQRWESFPDYDQLLWYRYYVNDKKDRIVLTLDGTANLYLLSSKAGKEISKKSHALVRLYNKTSQLTHAIDTMTESRDQLQSQIELLLAPKLADLELARIIDPNAAVASYITNYIKEIPMIYGIAGGESD